jgi:hypothetical protein
MEIEVLHLLIGTRRISPSLPQIGEFGKSGRQITAEIHDGGTELFGDFGNGLF